MLGFVSILYRLEQISGSCQQCMYSVCLCVICMQVTLMSVCSLKFRQVATVALLELLVVVLVGITELRS